MKRVKISISLHPALVKEIEELSKKTGENKSRVIEDACRRGLAQTQKMLEKWVLS